MAEGYHRRTANVVESRSFGGGARQGTWNARYIMKGLVLSRALMVAMACLVYMIVESARRECDRVSLRAVPKSDGLARAGSNDHGRSRPGYYLG